MSYSVIWNNEKGEQPEWHSWPLESIADSYRLKHKFSPVLTVAGTGGTIEPVDSKYGVFIYSGFNSAIVSSALQLSGAVLSGGGMTMHVYNKGSALDTTIDNDTMRIFAGGYASGVVFSSHVFTVRSGGFAENVVIASTGSAFISGAVTSLTQNNGSVFVEGGTVSGYTHNSYHADLFIRDGGMVVDMTQTANGGTTLSGGGMLSNAHISSGTLHISSGCTATVVEAPAGNVNVYDGGVLVSCALSNRGRLIMSGGSASGITVLSAGSATISSGGIATDVTQSGGSLYVSDGGVVSHAVGGPRILDGGYVVDLTVTSKNTARVFAGGSLATATVDNGGILQVSGGVASEVILLSGGTIMVSSGASAIDVTSADGARIDSKAGAYITYKQQA